MGNDGGSIPKRRELVKSAARAPTTSELKATALESLSHAWANCPLSSESLDKSNVVSDWRGRLYNYESILQGLMPSSSDLADINDTAGGRSPDDPVAPDHLASQVITFASTGIRSLKDVVKLQFTTSEGAKKGNEHVYVCPISQKEIGPGTKSVYIVPCGHVFYEVALKEVAPPEVGAAGDSKSKKHSCPQCSDEFEDGNVIPILPTQDTDVKRLSERIERLRAEGLTHKLKKDKNGKKDKKRKAENGGGKDGEPRNEKSGDRNKNKSHKLSGINNSATALLTAKVVAEMDANRKRRKLASV